MLAVKKLRKKKSDCDGFRSVQQSAIHQPDEVYLLKRRYDQQIKDLRGNNHVKYTFTAYMFCMQM